MLPPPPRTWEVVWAAGLLDLSVITPPPSHLPSPWASQTCTELAPLLSHPFLFSAAVSLLLPKFKPLFCAAIPSLHLVLHFQNLNDPECSGFPISILGLHSSSKFSSCIWNHPDCVLLSTLLSYLCWWQQCPCKHKTWGL